MPKWEIHKKWSDKIGISKEISNFVNKLIDFPEECKEFVDFCNEYDRKPKKGKRSKVITDALIKTVGRHDAGRGRKTAAYVQLEFLRPKGSEYVKAWYLHHILDYIKGAPILTVEEILERSEKKFSEEITMQEFKTVKNFVINYSEEILQDCR